MKLYETRVNRGEKTVAKGPFHGWKPRCAPCAACMSHPGRGLGKSLRLNRTFSSSFLIKPGGLPMSANEEFAHLGATLRTSVLGAQHVETSSDGAGVFGRACQEAVTALAWALGLESCGAGSARAQPCLGRRACDAGQGRGTCRASAGRSSTWLTHHELLEVVVQVARYAELAGAGGEPRDGWRPGRGRREPRAARGG